MRTETGKVIQVIGPVVDLEFPPGNLPNIFNAVKIEQPGNEKTGQSATNITLEVAQHLGETAVRTRGAFDNSPVPGEAPAFRVH